MPAPSMASLPEPRTRRAISVSTVFAALALFAVFSPFLFVAAAVADLARGIRGWRYIRLTAFCAHLLAIESAGLVAGACTWASAGFGTRIGSKKSQRTHGRLQGWYARSLMRAAETCLNLRIEIVGHELAQTGNAVMIGRHRSLPDALLPALICDGFDIERKYVLAGGLQWGPNLDIVGNRTDQVFVDRSASNSEQQLAQIKAMAGRIDDDSIGIIFPEGTFFSPERQARALDRIAASFPHELDRAQQLRHLLPPRPGGTAALLEAAPSADVIFLGHVGFESLSTVAEIAKSVPATNPVRVKLWRYDRSEVPTDQTRQRDWILDRWLEVDQWIEDQQR